MSRPSNIKIQKTGAEEIGNAEIPSPASDLGVREMEAWRLQSKTGILLV
jgi:hypothetical protein